MTLKRTYVIKFTTLKNEEYFIKELTKDLGYRFFSTKDIEKSFFWKNKKSAEKVVKELNNKLFEPGFDTQINGTHKYEVVETTPLKLLRLLKLKKIMKNN